MSRTATNKPSKVKLIKLKRHYLREGENLFVSLLFRAVYVYLLIVAAHVIGRFFYRNESRLDWF